jgi:hypothetical protein
LEWPSEGVCDCASQDTSEIQTIEGLSEGHDSGIPVDVSQILSEGKGVGTASHDIERDVILAYATTTGASFHKGKAKARSAARKKLERMLKRTYTKLLGLTTSYNKKDKGGYGKYSKEFKRVLKDAYYQAYELGLKSTGASAFLTAGGSRLVSQKDRKWIESAFRHEMRYLNKFLGDVKTNKASGRWPHRVGMYVATVGSIYYSGRVAVTPPNHALFWIAKLDNKICPQCKYMATNSPYTKFNMPITPASGHTRCLSNCRCAIAVRPVSQAYFERLRKGVSRATHLRRLKAALT